MTEKFSDVPEFDCSVGVNDEGAVEMWLDEDGYSFPPIDAYDLGNRLIVHAITAAGGVGALNIEILARDLGPIVSEMKSNGAAA